ncbi:TPA: hypothetical protein SE308_000714 [Campylobacter jejuni]|nr:hypothetical protein [Campylobacter jejuni]
MKLQDFDFRIWNIQEKHYITNNPCLVEFNHNPGEIKAGVLLVYEDREHEFLESWYDDIEIELWTGLYDKHGKKIYEGDILENKMTMEDLPYKVVFKWGAFYLVEIDENDEDLMDEFLFTELEVIGNIHENPELLKC